MNIDKYKLKITSQTIELEGELDRDLRTFVLAEYEIYAVETQDNQDGEYNLVYKAKLVGSSEVKQGNKLIKGKSKRSLSKKVRLALGDERYEKLMPIIIENPDDVYEYLINM